MTNNSNSTLQQQPGSNQASTQVIGARVSKEQWHQLEQKCLADKIPMSQVLQQAVANYLNN